MTISLLNEEQNLSIEPLIKSIYFNKIKSYQEEIKKFEEEDEFFGSYRQVSEKIAVEFDVYFKIEKCVWKIPYVIIFEKIYIKEDSKIKLLYIKSRIRLIEFQEISITNQALHPYLIHTLLLLDKNRCYYCLPQEFESQINERTFYFENDIKYNSNKNCLYKVTKSFYEPGETNNTNIILEADEQVSFEGELLNYNNKIIKGLYYLNIFPNGFSDSYRKEFIDAKGLIVELHPRYSSYDNMVQTHNFVNSEHAYTQGKEIFQGTHNQCLDFISDEKNITEIKNSITKNNIVKPDVIDGSDYYNSREAESDSFDAMTDGQLGSYDDFSGSIDDVDTWSRG